MHTDLISRLQNARAGIHIASAIGTDKALTPAINELLDATKEAEIALSAQPKPAEGGAVGSRLYHAINRLMAVIGCEGEINSKAAECAEVMAALTEIDGGTYKHAGSGEAVATALAQDPEFPGGPLFSREDWRRLAALPPGTPLYAGAPPADSEALKAEVIALANEHEEGYRNREHGDVLNARITDKVVEMARRLSGKGE